MRTNLPQRETGDTAGHPARCAGRGISALRAVAVAGVLLGAALVLSGCELSYYWQAGMGQLEILRERRPIAEALQDPQVPTEIKDKLRLVRDVQDFGVERLHLPPESRYTLYADLGRPYVSWLVVASRPFAFESVEHCFPIAGCFGYRGYFDRADARAYADQLDADGYDVLVRPVRAYSTLGWFEDPVLNTFLRGSKLGIMGTILHEQAHREVWAEDDTTFNESYASFVEETGVRHYLEQRYGEDADMLQRYADRRHDVKLFRRILRRGRERLEALYARDLPPKRMRERKRALFEALRADYEKRKASFRLLSYEDWFARELNNAHLVSVGQYHLRVEAFRALFVQQGRDFARFHEAARALAEQPRAERRKALDALEGDELAGS